VVLEYAYDVASPEQLAARRAPLRAAHLAHAAAARARGELLMGGATTASAAAAAGGATLGGLLVFRGAGEGAARSFAEADPYVTQALAETGRPLVKSWSTRSWAVVIGGDLR